MITVEHENSMQTIWEHEMIRDKCSWKELAEVAWATQKEATQSARLQEKEPGRRHWEKGAARGRECRRERRE